ncbi:hypothetical protein EWM64_g10944 [Hericium alpestre]|uniref:mevalonate kinase n=1 Tax=Hericium alpestre TaxID=135208 RepID=A0A4Y9ZH10_9AGAM|nr:hypothetical protein EWM64_g10944 [Hericium alpestre]
MEAISGFKSLRFLLTDSKVPRDTKRLVAGVSQKKLEDPETIGRILDAIQTITDEARRALMDTELPRDALLSALSALINENHAHLVSLGVSHPVLEDIRARTAAEPYRLSTKLTGAGGGGCAVTLIPDDLDESILRELVDSLSDTAFVPYLTSVGGSGLGFLSPHQPDNYAGPVTPPETPGEGEREVRRASLQAAFEEKAIPELAEWAAGRGRWLYV